MDINDNEIDLDLIDPRYKVFVREYITSGNGTQSALKAGYKDTAARSTASRILRRNDVQAYMAALNSKADSDTVASYDEVRRILTGILRGERSDPAIDVKGNVHQIAVHSREIAKVADVYASMNGWKTDNIHLQSDNTVQFIDDLSKPNKAK